MKKLHVVNKSKQVIIGNRRFTCLSPHLSRMEFCPNAKFEDRRSIICSEKQNPISFKQITEKEGRLYLDTGKTTIISSDNEKDFFPSNLEVRWIRDGLLQFWRPGDRDHQNLGGTVRSLDQFSKYSNLKKSHVADESHPDSKANVWLIRDIELDQVDLNFEEKTCLSPNKEEVFKDGIHGFTKFNPKKVRIRTLNNVFDQYQYSPGILSRSGYYLLNDSITAVMDADDFPIERNTPGTKDYYFFCYDDDYKSALKDFILIAGKSPIPSKNVFGILFSRWPAFDELESQTLVSEFNNNGIPLSVLVLDLEWHGDMWCHWEWDNKRYSNPENFLNRCHENNIEVALNVHYNWLPENIHNFKEFLNAVKNNDGSIDDVDDGQDMGLRRIILNACDKKQTFPFMKYFPTPLVEQGVDFWWTDGTSQRGFCNGASSQLITNKVFFENIEKASGLKKRGMLLSRYGGMGSHRYGVVFTGDTECQWEVLQKLCEFNIRAGHLGISYISHDVGGFGLSFPEAKIIDPILYLRWVQFAVFNPVLRFHCSKTSGSRKPWDYGNDISNNSLLWLKFRNSLIPYIYSEARIHYEIGIPITRGLFIEHPKDDFCYRFDEFYFGSCLLVAPILESSNWRNIYLPEGIWYNYKTGNIIQGGKEFTYKVPLEDIPIFAKAGSIIPRQDESSIPSANHAYKLILDIFPHVSGAEAKISTYELYEDNSKSLAYKSGIFAKTQFTLQLKQEELTIKISDIMGQPLGKTREITLNVILSQKPQNVLLNDKIVKPEFYEYNLKTKRFTFYLPVIKANEKFELCLKLGTS